MHCYNKEIGSYGEDLAEKYLLNCGYNIIERNYKCRIGEIDIICFDNPYLVFLEVKTRYNKNYGFPCEAVGREKQLKIYKTAQNYILKQKLFKSNIRFDVIEILLNQNGGESEINLIKDAFQIYL